MQRREEVQVAKVTIENNAEEEGNIAEPVVNNDEEEQLLVNIEVAENVLINNDEELSKKDKELEQYFQLELENLHHSTLLHMEPREKLPKVTLSDEIQERASKILGLYLPSADTIPEITDIVYVMEKAIGYTTGIKPEGGNENRPKKAEGGNRRERRNERAETRCTQSRKQTPSSKAAKEIQKKKRETDHGRTWNENEW